MYYVGTVKRIATERCKTSVKMLLSPFGLGYGKSREKRRKRRITQHYTFTCEKCGTVLRWHVPRKEGVFCEKLGRIKS